MVRTADGNLNGPISEPKRSRPALALAPLLKHNIGGTMQTSSSHSATIFQPNQGKTFSFFGNTVICKFSGNGEDGRIYELLSTASSGVPPLHTHPWDEWFYFLEGEVNFQVGDRVVEATPGYVVNLPAGVPHTFQVKSPRAKFLVWVSNAAAETYINELAEMARGRDLTPEEVMAIGQKHHIQYKRTLCQ